MHEHLDVRCKATSWELFGMQKADHYRTEWWVIGSISDFVDLETISDQFLDVLTWYSSEWGACHLGLWESCESVLDSSQSGLIGDSLYCQISAMDFPGIPSLSPHFLCAAWPAQNLGELQDAKVLQPVWPSMLSFELPESRLFSKSQIMWVQRTWLGNESSVCIFLNFHCHEWHGKISRIHKLRSRALAEFAVATSLKSKCLIMTHVLCIELL